MKLYLYLGRLGRCDQVQKWRVFVEIHPVPLTGKVAANAPRLSYNTPPSTPRIRKLNEAVTRGSLARVQELVEEWLAMPNATKDLPPGPPGYTIGALEPVLHHAVRKSKGKIVSYLMDEGIPMSEAALRDALDCQASNDVFEAFLDHGWDINADLRGTPTPLTYVLDNERLLQWFLDHGANPNTSCSTRKTPFEQAARSCPLSTVQLLYKRGALPGNTAPVAAKSEVPGRLEVLRFLLDIGAPINAMDHDHIPGGVGTQIIVGTPLMHACTSDTEETDAMVEMLLQRGAKIDICDQNRETAMDKAKQWGNPRKAELLQIYMKKRLLDGIPVKTE